MVAPAARLPPAVVSQILNQATNFMTREKELCRYGRVHRSWTEPAQELLWQEVGLWDPARITQAVNSGLTGRHPTKLVTLLGGRGTRKVRAELAEQLLANLTQIKSLVIRSIIDLTPNSFFAIPSLGTTIKSIEINMAVKNTPSALQSIPCPPQIPLQRLKLGPQSVALSFLIPLFAAATATLTALTITLNPRTTPNLIKACPTILPHLTQLNIEGPRGLFLTAVETPFLALLSVCVRLRSLGWEWADYRQLRLATRHLPDRGARLERIKFNLYGAVSMRRRVEEVMHKAEYARLREVGVVGKRDKGASELEEVRRVCAERRVLFK